MNKRGRNELWVVEICLVLCYGLRAEMKETVRFNRKKRRPTRVTFYTAQRPELHTEKREKEPMNVTGDVRPKAEENSFPSKIFRLFIFFFLGVAGYCWTRQPKKKKSRGGKNLYRIDAISFPSGLRLTRMRTVEANIQQYRYIYAESLRTGGCECASPSSFCAFFCAEYQLTSLSHGVDK